MRSQKWYLPADVSHKGLGQWGMQLVRHLRSVLYALIRVVVPPFPEQNGLDDNKDHEGKEDHVFD